MKSKIRKFHYVEGINEAEDRRENILPREGLRPQVLDAGVNDVTQHGHGLCDHDNDDD